MTHQPFGRKIASNLLLAMASNLAAMACNLVGMASNLQYSIEKLERFNTHQSIEPLCQRS